MATATATAVKNEFIVYQQCSRLVQYGSGSKNVLRLNMQWQCSVSNKNTKTTQNLEGNEMLRDL